MKRSAGLEGIAVPSEAAILYGGLYVAEGDGPAPSVVLLHGLPGHEQNLDLAQRLRTLGITVCFFHYRGSWGSEGEFALHHALADAQCVVRWMLQRSDVDPARLALVGISFGGWVALQLAAREPRIRCLVAISPLLDPRRPTRPGLMSPEMAEAFAAPLAGVSAQQLKMEWDQLPSALERREALQERAILMVTAEADELFPPEHYEGVSALLPALKHVQFPRSDHVYSAVRPGLCHTVASWLAQQLLLPAATGRG